MLEKQSPLIPSHQTVFFFLCSLLYLVYGTRLSRVVLTEGASSIRSHLRPHLI